MIAYLLFTAELKVLASLQRHLVLEFACGTFQPEDNLLGRLCLLVEHRFCLTTVTRLLTVVSALTFSRRK